MQDLGALRARLLFETQQFSAGMQHARNEMRETGTTAVTTGQAIGRIGGSSPIISAQQLGSLSLVQRELLQTTLQARTTNIALHNINNTQIFGPTVTQNITNVNNHLNNTSNAANNAKNSFNKLQNVSAGVTAAIGVAFAASVATAANFEQKMKDVEAVAGATGNEMKQLGDLAMEMGEKTAFSASGAAMGIEELVKAGLTVTQILDGGLQGALDLATAGGLELAEAAEIASTALNAFSDDNLKVADAANILAGAANASATDVGELKYGLSAVSAVAAGVGLSFKDTSTALAVFAQNGLKGSDAGTSLKTMLMNLQPSTVTQIDEFERLGLMSYDVTKGLKVLADNGIKPASTSFKDVDKSLKSFATTMSGAKAGSEKAQKEYTKLIMQTGVLQSSFYDAEGSIRSMDEIAGVLQGSLTGMTDAQRAASLEIMFGSDAIRAGNILYKEGKDGLNNMWDAMSKVTAAEVAATKLDTLKGAFEELKGVLESAAIDIGEDFLPALKDITKYVTELIRSFDSADLAGLKTALTFAGVTSAIVLVGATLAKVGLTLSAFALTPVGAAIIGLALLGGAFAAVKMHQSDSNKVTLDSVLAMEKQRDELKKNISAYDDLKSKSQLSNKELARFVDINSEITKTADPKVIAELTTEQDRLREKSGLSNAQLEEMVRLNGEILKAVPESNTVLTDQGNVLLNNTDAAKKFNEKQLEMIRLELEAKKAKAEANMAGYLENEIKLKQDIIDLGKEKAGYDVEEFKQRDKLRTLQGELTTAKANGDTLEQERLTRTIDMENNKLEGIKKQRAEAAELIVKRTEEINKIQEQIGKLDEVKRKMIDIELRQVGLNAKRGEEIATIDSAISKLQTQKQKIELNTSAADKNTQEYRDAVGAIESQIGELNTVRGRVIDITGQAGNMNRELGKDINKTITINQRVGRTIGAIPNQGRGNVGSEFHTGGIIGQMPKLHAGGLASQFMTAPMHNEIDIRALPNEMVLTESQQSNLFRMIDAGFTKTGQNSEASLNSEVIALLREIERGIARGLNATVIMDEREVGRILEPHITEEQDYRKGRF